MQCKEYMSIFHPIFIHTHIHKQQGSKQANQPASQPAIYPSIYPYILLSLYCCCFCCCCCYYIYTTFTNCNVYYFDCFEKYQAASKCFRKFFKCKIQLEFVSLFTLLHFTIFPRKKKIFFCSVV